MKLTISLPDDLYDEITVKSKESKLNLNDWLVKRLLATKDLDLAARFVLLSGDSLIETEAALDSNHLTSSDAFLSALKKRLTISFGGIDLKLSVGELAELTRRAERNRRTPEEELKYAIQIVKPLIFHAAGDVFPDMAQV